MKTYYVNDNAQDGGEHEVHVETCPYIPQIVSKKDLGQFNKACPAVVKARDFYDNVDGCARCMPECHSK